MAGSIYDWSTTAASNGNADASINFAEGQAPSTVNDSARQMMGREAEILKDLGGGIAAGGTANALTLTAASAFTTLADGRIVAFRATADNAAGVTTINVNAISVKSIRKMVGSGETDLAAGDIKNGGIFVIRYGTAFNGAAGAWMLQNPVIDLPSLVTLTGTQTLTNKTLTSPTINTPTLSGGTSASMTMTGAALNGTLGATTPNTVAGTTGAFSGNVTITDPSGFLGFKIIGHATNWSGNGYYNSSSQLRWGVVYNGGTAGTFAIQRFTGASVYQNDVISIDNATGNVTVNGTLNATALQQGGFAFPFTKSFESAQQTITSGGLLTLAHGLGVQPKLYQAYAVCQTAEFGYSIGDEVLLNPSGHNEAAANQGFVLVPDATNLNVRMGSATPAFRLNNKTTGGNVSPTNANWKFVFRAWA